jgi:hypothetical protein
MDKVIFTYFEHADDIIISLSCDEASIFGVDGFIIQRTPKYEFTLPPHERGACVEWDEADDIPVLLDRVFITRNEMRVVTRGKIREHQFDLQVITDDEYQALLKHLRLINFDHSFKLEIE